LLIRSVLAMALLMPVVLIASPPAFAATTIAPTVTCGMALGDLGGRGLICEVTVVNSITTAGGSSTVTVRECLGSAGAPTDGSGGGGFGCSTKTSNLTQPVTAVTQCNNSINGGGGTLRCSVNVTNQFMSGAPGSTAVSVNQCVGSGASGSIGHTIKCDPFPASTTSAAITQCNGSANGGSLVGLTCTATGTMASALAVKILQCQGSANGGGALVICSANVVNAAGAVPTGSPAVSPTGSPAVSPTGSPAVSPAAPNASARTIPPTTTEDTRSSSNGSGVPFTFLVSLLFGGLGALALVAQRRRLRS
jgi:hypothetical protein